MTTQATMETSAKYDHSTHQTYVTHTQDYNSNQYQPLYKYITREKILHHRHYLRFDPVSGRVYEYCRERECLRRNQEHMYRNDLVDSKIGSSQWKNDNHKVKDKMNYFIKYDTRSHNKYHESMEQECNRNVFTYVKKPDVIYDKIDEYYVENEKLNAAEKLMMRNDARTKAEIIQNFQDLYEDHCRFVQAQNLYLQDQLELVRARQLKIANSEKARWMANHAHAFRKNKVENQPQQYFTTEGIFLKENRTPKHRVKKDGKRGIQHLVPVAVI